MHVHAAPDVGDRALDWVELGQGANAAGMAGLVLKDHALPTAGQAYVLNKTLRGNCRFYGSITLNPTVGGLNLAAVQAALQHGAAVVYLPTYSAAHHVNRLGSHHRRYPMKGMAATGMSLHDSTIHDQLLPILEEIARYDAILATGHISPTECLLAISEARTAGVSRIVVTHASMPGIGLSVDDQKKAVDLGAYIEHSFVACTSVAGSPIPVEVIRNQIAHVGADRCVLSSDFGQVANGSPVDGLKRHLQLLHDAGISVAAITTMIRDNPRKLLAGK